MRVPSFYVTTEDLKGNDHRFKVSLNETLPEGHAVTDSRQAETFRFSSLLSPESVTNLLTSVR